MNFEKMCASMILLIMIGLGLMIPSMLILGTIILAPYSSRALLIKIGASLYIASALMALASVPLINKKLTKGYIMGILSCILSFSTFITLLTLMILGIGQFGHYYEYQQIAMLLLVIGGLALIPELIISMLLATIWGESKRDLMKEKAKTTTEI
jgi:hypothetical protein